jgi:antirestriction protein ArdC
VAPGIRPKAREDHSSFIHDSLNALKDDRRTIFQTAADSRQAVDYLHSLQRKVEDEST